MSKICFDILQSNLTLHFFFSIIIRKIRVAWKKNISSFFSCGAFNEIPQRKKKSHHCCAEENIRAENYGYYTKMSALFCYLFSQNWLRTVIMNVHCATIRIAEVPEPMRSLRALLVVHVCLIQK